VPDVPYRAWRQSEARPLGVEIVHGMGARSLWGDRITCLCGVPCIYDREWQMWIGTDVDRSRLDDDDYDPEHVFFHAPEVDEQAAEVRRLMAEPKVEPRRRQRLCTEVPGCNGWEGHVGDHTGRGIARHTRTLERAWEESKGLDPDKPRETMPSRIDRSGEYARRNRQRRMERAARDATR
jgi:hypothetical protein